MKLFFNFTVLRFANTYLLGPEDGGDAVLIDPSVMDVDLLTLIETNNYYIRHVLLTHNHSTHTKGVNTLLKIYDAKIYAYMPQIFDIETYPLTDGDKLNLAGIPIEILYLAGHSSDSLVFKVKNLLFTGDVLSAGIIGDSPNSLSKSLLLRSIQEKIYPLDDSTLIFPGHGPPSILKAEKLFNPDLKLLEKI